MTPPRWTSPLTGSTVHEADARTIAATLPDGCASAAILDGPYGMGKAAWDRVPRGGSLLDLYRDHLADVGRVCAPSASLYLWNTAEGWGELHPAILAAGWTFRSLITWDKGDGFMAGKCDVGALRTWYDLTEVCGFYQRGPDWPRLVRSAVAKSGATRTALCERIGCDSRLLQFWEDGERFPSFDLWKSLWSAVNSGSFGLFGTKLYLLQARGNVYPYTEDELRAEWEALRPPFTAPMGLGNVWRAPTVAGPERLRAPDGSTLHPCQKPLAFAERMLRASTRPGDIVWVPFGGTLREVVAAEHMARRDPAEARRVVTCELNADGQDYIGPALAQAEGRSLLDVPATQGRLF